MANPNLFTNAELETIKTKDDEIKDLKNKIGKYDWENVSKSLTIDNVYYRKECKSLY